MSAHIQGMEKNTPDQAAETAGLLRTVRSELATLPSGAWERYGACIEGGEDQYGVILDVEVECGSYCQGGRAKAVIAPEAESFLLNSGQRMLRMVTALEAVLSVHRKIPSAGEDGELTGPGCCEACTDLDEASGERIHELYPCFTVQEINRALAGEETRMELRSRMEAKIPAGKDAF